jgi:hypothetical protein
LFFRSALLGLLYDDLVPVAAVRDLYVVALVPVCTTPVGRLL